jgi:hypothetical protein
LAAVRKDRVDMLTKSINKPIESIGVFI